MLKKMLVQGLVGAALIGIAAAAYSQVQAQEKPQDNGYLAVPDRTKGSDRDGQPKKHDTRAGEHRERHADRDRARMPGHDRDRD